MVRRNRLQARRVSLVAIVVTLSAWLLATTPSSADVSAVRGRAFGIFVSATVPGGASGTRGPEPVVELAPDASNSPQTATAGQGVVIIGPAELLSWSTIDVTTQGATGPNGFVTSTATVTNVNRRQSEVFTAAAVTAMCRADESGVSGSTTIGTAAAPGGVLQLDQGNDDPEDAIPDHPPVTVNIPPNPAPNTTFEGHVHPGGDTDSFRYVFNEQIVNPDGSITVRAAHQYFLGPLVTGDVIIGEVTCGITATAPTTTTTSTTIPPTTTSTSTTIPPTTTSTSTTIPPTTTSTSTTIPPTTTSTSTTTTTTLPPITTTTAPPTDGTCAQLQQQRAAFNAQITALEQSLSQVLSGPALEATIARLEATRAAGNAQFDLALANCGPTTPTTTSSTTTTTTTIPPTTTTTAPPVPDFTQLACTILRGLADNPFLAPFIQAFLAAFGCNAGI